MIPDLLSLAGKTPSQRPSADRGGRVSMRFAQVPTGFKATPSM
jgi:hypothetical protein